MEFEKGGINGRMKVQNRRIHLNLFIHTVKRDWFKCLRKVFGGKSGDARTLSVDDFRPGLL